MIERVGIIGLGLMGSGMANNLIRGGHQPIGFDVDPQRIAADGVGSSKIIEIRGPMIVNDDYTPSARPDLMVKDSAIIKEFAAGSGAVTPLLDAAIPVYVAASESGQGGLDAAALYLYLQQLAGESRE